MSFCCLLVVGVVSFAALAVPRWFRRIIHILPASLPPSPEATAAAAARTGAPLGELTNAHTAKEPATAMASAGEEEEC